ncbi:hypothetical protein HG530_015172 [Fusarium avenaceum]|nr:hypothetical protein HG530_015172 [Fusarium avenaceum]
MESPAPNSSLESAQRPSGKPYLLDNNIVINIYHLPDDLLSDIFSYAAVPKSLPAQLKIGKATDDIYLDPEEYQGSLAKAFRTARALRLVSRRFNYLATPFLFQHLILIQYVVETLPDGSLAERQQYPGSVAQQGKTFGEMMKNLHGLLAMRPDLGHHCKSLCFTFKEDSQPYDSRYETDEDSGEDGEGKRPQNYIEFPQTVLLNDIYSLMANVRDFQVDVTDLTEKMPEFSQALASMPRLTRLYIMGDVEYLPLVRQIATLPSESMLETLDISCTTAIECVQDEYEAQQAAMLQELQSYAGTGPFTRLLTGFPLGPELLVPLVAWPKRLERLALQIKSQITRHSPQNVPLQPILDTQKQSLTHLCIEGNYGPGLKGFDLRDFPRLEYLALTDSVFSHFDAFRDGRIAPELNARIFAPRLRSFLWVLPRGGTIRRPKIKDFFSDKHEERLRYVLQTALHLKEQSKNTGDWHFKRIWVQSSVMAPESLGQEARRNFENDLRRIDALNDEFGPLEISVRHLPFAKSSTNGDNADGYGWWIG